MDTWITTALYILSVMRVTRLINYDLLLDRMHVWAGEKFGPGAWFPHFLECSWCISMWVGLATAWGPIMLLDISWWNYPLLALGASMVTGLFDPLSSEETGLERTA